MANIVAAIDTAMYAIIGRLKGLALSSRHENIHRPMIESVNIYIIVIFGRSNAARGSVEKNKTANTNVAIMNDTMILFNTL